MCREAALKTEILHFPSQKQTVSFVLQSPCPAGLPPALPRMARGISAAGMVLGLAETSITVPAQW